MQRYRVNFPLLIGLVVGAVVIVGGGYGLWTVQQSRNAGRLLTLAEEAQDEGDLVEAAKMYGRYLAIRTDDEVVTAKFANTYADLAEGPDVEPKEIRAALGLLENTVREQPNNALLRRRLVDMLMKYRMLKPALDHISQLINQDPGDTELQLMRSECLFSSNDPKAITHAFEMIGYNETTDSFDADSAKAPNEPDLYRRLAVSLRRDRNERELADRVIDQMIAANEDDGTAHLLRGKYLGVYGEEEDSQEAIDRAIEIAPDDPAIVTAAARLEMQQAMKLEKDDYEDDDALKEARQVFFDRARKLLEDCLAANPDSAGLYQMLASVEVREGDYEGAMRLYDTGIKEVSPRAAQMLWFSKARLQIERDEIDAAEASIASMREAEFMAPPFIDYLAARLQMTEGKWFDASTELDRLQAFMTNIPGMATELNFLLGLCYEKLGQFERALGAYDVALQADPLNKAAGFGRTRALNAMGQATRDADNLTLYALMQDELNKPESEQDWVAFDVLMDRYVEKLELGPAMRRVLAGEVFMRRGMYAEAREALRDSFELDRDNLAVRRAAVKLFASDPAQGPVRALKLLDKVVEDFGDMPILRLERADLLIAVNDEDLVDQLFALTRGIDDWEAREKVQLWNGMGEKFARLRDRESQMVALKKVAELSPDALPTLMRMFKMGRESGDEAAMKDAQERILAIVGSKNDPTYRLTEAYQLLFNSGRDQGEREKRIAQAEELIEQALADRPDWNELYIAQASMALLQNDQGAALEALDKAASLGRPSTLSLYQHVKLLASRGRYADALKQMERVPPEARRALLGRDYAEALLNTGRLSDAIAAGTQFSESAKNNASVRLWHGRFLSRASLDSSLTEERRNSLREEAGESFEAAVEIDPSSAEAWLALITFKATTGDLVGAEERIRQAQLALTEDKTLLMFARCYEVIGRWVDAEALYQQAVEEADERDVARAKRLLAAFYLGPGYTKPQAEKTEKATPLINDILRMVADDELEANNSSARWARSTAARIFAREGQYQAIRNAERLLSSNVVDGELPAGDRKLMAEILAARPEPASRLKAVELIEGLRQNQKLVLKTELDLARLYFSLGEWRKCKEQMIDVISEYPNEPLVRRLYLNMLLKRGGPRDIDLAVPQLNKLSKLAPNEATTREMIARVASKRGKAKEAAAALRGMLPRDLSSITQKQIPAVLRVARLLTELEDYDRAGPLFRLAAEKGDISAKLEEALFVGQHVDVAQAFELLGKIRRETPGPQLIQIGTTILRRPVDEAAVESQLVTLQDWLDRALREDPNSVPLRLQRAEVKEIARDYPTAVTLYEELLESGELQGTGRAVVLNNLAYLLALTRDDDTALSDARRYIKEAVDLLGPQTDVLDTRAVIAIAAEDYDGALVDLELAVIDSPSAAKFFHKATAHLLAGQPQEAAAAWRKALDLGLTRDSVSRLERERYDTLKSQLDGLDQRSAQL